MGHLLKSELGDGPYMAGSEFTALDIVFGYNMEVPPQLIKLTIINNIILSGNRFRMSTFYLPVRCQKSANFSISDDLLQEGVVCGRADELEGILPEAQTRQAPLPKGFPVNRREIFELVSNSDPPRYTML